MHWRHKARIQRLLAALPRSVGDAIYYQLQCRFGDLRNSSPWTRLEYGAETARLFAKFAGPVAGRSFLEIGTGRRLNVPIVLWLLGAEQVICTDLHGYLKADLVRRDIEWIRKNAARVRELLPDADPNRFAALLSNGGQPDAIRYHPQTAANALPVPDSSIDAHISCNVLEHIPPSDIPPLLAEARRIIKPDGLLIHKTDHRDHFHRDFRSISPINFLRFTEAEWLALAGNRFMYANRLRIDDLRDCFEAAACPPKLLRPGIDTALLGEIQNQPPPLSAEFADKPAEVLAVVSSWIVA
ncbi:MAG: SAM-dependent methyltransferase [Rhodothermales bacterium]|jgi:SAM-dependent methyltransferase